MNAGSFDELISLQSYTTITDGNTGEKLQTWAQYATEWAQVVEAPAGIEQVNGDRREHKQTIDFIIRYNASVSVYHRIEWGGAYYNIINIQDLQRRMYLKLQTELTK